MLRKHRVNLQHSSYKHVFSKSILVENNVDPDQTASTEASCSGSTVFPKRIQNLSIFLFILYTGSNSEDPDEMQHKDLFNNVK